MEIYRPVQGLIHIQCLVELRGARLLEGTVKGIDAQEGRLYLTGGEKIG